MAGNNHGEREPWIDLGTELVIDQDTVKCWIETVPPGAQRPVHTHRHPWVTVVLAGAAGESLGPDGTVLSRSTVQTGQVSYNGRERIPLQHCVRNTSDSTLIMVAIELRPATDEETTGEIWPQH